MFDGSAFGNFMAVGLIVALIIGIVAGIAVWELVQYLWAHISITWT